MLLSQDKRTYEMERQVPDVIDLTVMAVESGLGFDGALDFIANRLSGPLAEECREASRRAQSAPDPREAWLGLSHRLKLPDFTDFIGSVLQARQSGLSLGNVLRQKSEEIRRRRLQKAREEANQLPTKLIVVNVILVPCMIAELVLFLLLPPWLALLLWVPAVVVLVGSYRALGGEREIDRQDQQLADAIALAVGGLRVGHGLDQSLASAAVSAGDTVGTELEHVCEDLKAGKPPAEAFERLAGRFGRREVDLLVTGLELQRQTGGSLAGVLSRASQLIAERVRVRGEIRALTAQGQFSTYLMTGIPLGLAFLARLVGIKLGDLVSLSPLLPALGIGGIYAVQSAVHRTARGILASVDRFMP